jgi:hypothetical protein
MPGPRRTVSALGSARGYRRNDSWGTEHENVSQSAARARLPDSSGCSHAWLMRQPEPTRGGPPVQAPTSSERLPQAK